MQYLVRCNCEYSTLVEATSAAEALAKAEGIDFDDPAWDEAWSEMEAEEGNKP